MKRWIVWMMAAAISVVGLIGCGQQSAQTSASAEPPAQVAPATPEVPAATEKAPAATPEAPTQEAKTPGAAEAGSGIKVITAADWSGTHPDIYASYMKNADNKEQTDYVKDHPEIAVLYEGMGFSKFYNSARGHVYTVEDLTATGRPHALANCFACKTPDFTAAVMEKGDAAYQIPFEDMLADVKEPISCFNCHANEPGGLVVTHTYLADALGSDLQSVNPATLACGQCHVEYHFDPTTKAVTLPYSGLSDMNPDAILEYYNNMYVNDEVFADYVNPRSGVRQIKAQHPEFETQLGPGSRHTNLTCADCHMGEAVNADGQPYANHEWLSPLENTALAEANCSVCHADLAGFVQAIQEPVKQRTTEVGKALESLTEKLVTAVESGQYSEEQLDAIRSLARNAQFYWDFVFVENSYGAHNSTLTYQCLDKSEKLLEEALLLF